MGEHTDCDAIRYPAGVARFLRYRNLRKTDLAVLLLTAQLVYRMGEYTDCDAIRYPAGVARFLR